MVQFHIFNSVHLVNFKVDNFFYKSKGVHFFFFFDDESRGVHTTTYFKILNDLVVYILQDLENKI